MAMAAKRSDADKSDIAQWIMRVDHEDWCLVAGKVAAFVRQEQCAGQGAEQGQGRGRGGVAVCVGKRVRVSVC